MQVIQVPLIIMLCGEEGTKWYKNEILTEDLS